MKAAGDLPLTVKMRKGIDDDHLTYLEAARMAAGAGVACIALHARTASQFYSGHADWSAIAKLKETITDVPVLGNGDIWSAEDAIRMVEETGCDGVVVGRGCLGRPWLFGDLAAAFGAALPDAPDGAGDPWAASRGSGTGTAQPNLGVVAAALRRHTELLIEFFGSEEWACRDIRKHISWYFKGYPVGGDTRSALALVESLQQMDDLLGHARLVRAIPGRAARRDSGAAPAPPSAPHCRRAGCSAMSWARSTADS